MTPSFVPTILQPLPALRAGEGVGTSLLPGEGEAPNLLAREGDGEERPLGEEQEPKLFGLNQPPPPLSLGRGELKEKSSKYF